MSKKEKDFLKHLEDLIKINEVAAKNSPQNEEWSLGVAKGIALAKALFILNVKS